MEKIKASIKSFVEGEKVKDILVIMIVILVGLGSFELGRLSKGDNGSGIRIEYIDPSGQGANVLEALVNNEANADTTKSSGKNFFASSRGKKYYPLGCSAGKTIKQENRIYWDTALEAEKAGYTLSSSC